MKKECYHVSIFWKGGGGGLECPPVYGKSNKDCTRGKLAVHGPPGYQAGHFTKSPLATSWRGAYNRCILSDIKGKKNNPFSIAHTYMACPLIVSAERLFEDFPCV